MPMPSGLVLRIAAAAVTGKSDGATLAYTDILDVSGAGNHPIGILVQNPPGGGTIKYKATADGGDPTFEFAGASLRFNNFVQSLGLTEAEIMVRIRRITNPLINDDIGLWAFGTYDGSARAHWPSTDGKIYERFCSTFRRDAVVPVVGTTTFQVYGVSSQTVGGAITKAQILYQDGSEIAHTTSGSFQTGSSGTKIMIGASEDNASNFVFRGYISDLMIFDHKLSSGDRSDAIAEIGNYSAAPTPLSPPAFRPLVPRFYPPRRRLI